MINTTRYCYYYFKNALGYLEINVVMRRKPHTLNSIKRRFHITKKIIFISAVVERSSFLDHLT